MYISVFLIGILFSFFSKRNKYLYNVYLFLLMLVAAFRFGVGADYFSYEYLYNILSKSLVSEIFNGQATLEIGFRTIGVLFRKLDASYFIYIAFLSVINLAYMSKLTKKYAINPVAALTFFYSMFYLVWTFSGLRQGITLAIGSCILIEALDSKKPGKIVLASILLSTIHVSALIFILFYFLAKLKWNQKKILIFSIVCVLISFVPLHSILNKLRDIPLIGKAAGYIDPPGTILQRLNFPSIARICFLIVGIFFYNKLAAYNRNMLNVYIIGLCLYFLFKSSELIASRLSIYGFIYTPIILINIIYLSPKKEARIALSLLFTVLSFFYLLKELNTLRNQSGFEDYKNRSYMPYTNIFNRFEEYTFRISYGLKVNSKYFK